MQSATFCRVARYLRMVQNLSRKQERRGTRNLFLGIVVVAFVVGIGLTVWPWVSPQTIKDRPTETTGRHTSQQQGVSIAGQTTGQAPEVSGTSPETATTTGRGPNVTATATHSLDLKKDQIDAIKKYAANQPKAGDQDVNFTITVGASVPHQVQLHDMPADLAKTMPPYKDDQYFVTPDQFVIVEKASRRIVAIVPTA